MQSSPASTTCRNASLHSVPKPNHRTQPSDQGTHIKQNGQIGELKIWRLMTLLVAIVRETCGWVWVWVGGKGRLSSSTLKEREGRLGLCKPLPPPPKTGLVFIPAVPLTTDVASCCRVPCAERDQMFLRFCALESKVCAHTTRRKTGRSDHAIRRKNDTERTQDQVRL